MSFLDTLEKHRAFAVIRTESSDNALDKALACIKGGIELIEVTFSFDGAEDVIRELSSRNDVCVGAGTVLRMEQARKAAAMGARFIVSPHTDREIIEFAKKNGIFAVSGAQTSNEIVNAWNMGADMVKVFPASHAGGPKYIKAVKDPLPFVRILVTGGVSTENCVEYIRHGATAVGIWSSLFGSDGKAPLGEITENAKALVARIEEYNTKG